MRRWEGNGVRGSTSANAEARGSNATVPGCTGTPRRCGWPGRGVTDRDSAWTVLAA